MEAEAIDIAAEERRANERICQIDAQKINQLQELHNRSKVRIVSVVNTLFYRICPFLLFVEFGIVWCSGVILSLAAEFVHFY